MRPNKLEVSVTLFKFEVSVALIQLHRFMNAISYYEYFLKLKYKQKKKD